MSDPYIGEIRMFGFGTRGAAACSDGASVCTTKPSASRAQVTRANAPPIGWLIFNGLTAQAFFPTVTIAIGGPTPPPGG